MIGSKVTTILLDGWILPVGGVASSRVSAQPAEQACLLGIYCFNLALYKILIAQH